jgi:hypothetical protein
MKTSAQIFVAVLGLIAAMQVTAATYEVNFAADLRGSLFDGKGSFDFDGTNYTDVNIVTTGYDSETYDWVLGAGGDSTTLIVHSGSPGWTKGEHRLRLEFDSPLTSTGGLANITGGQIDRCIDDNGRICSYSITGGTVSGGNVSAVPIPAAAWLFGSGLIGLVGVKRGQRS